MLDSTEKSQETRLFDGTRPWEDVVSLTLGGKTDEDVRITGAVAPVDKKRTIVTIIACILICLGAAILIWVWATPIYNAYLQDMQFSQSVDHYKQVDPAIKDAELADAQNYNRRYAGEQVDVPVSPYREQLDRPEGDIMGWLQIPSIDTTLPIYHTDSDETLMMGLGHLEESALPVGGETSHVLITGHSGMPRMRMFDDLEKLEKGDVFVIWVLGDPYAYRVYEIDRVLPDQVDKLYARQGEDIVSLITCTPYGINSHRLLVHGARCDYDPEAFATAAHHPTSNRLPALIGGTLAIGLIPLLFIIFVLGRRRWFLNRIITQDGRIIGEDELVDIRRANDFERFSLDMKPWRRARLQIFGVEIKGSWKRVRKGEVEFNFRREDGESGTTTGGMAVGDIRATEVAAAVDDRPIIIETASLLGFNLAIASKPASAYGRDKELGMFANENTAVLAFGNHPATKSQQQEEAAGGSV